MNKENTTVDTYLSTFPAAVQERLNALRHCILLNAPGADESMAYGMPAYKLHKKPLVYFGAFTHHIGLYATPTGHTKFKKALSVYKQGKGSVQFPHSKPLPMDLIEDIIRFRVKENMQQKP
ncbi:MAG TPA: DUF1801 domain-containing protein [Ferruginibacter sp.]|nr:DUF1801 domain-containing protein [Ferruginibacter sp.]HMP19352.1 DUF1801 domain-containing protein [Ferruginibacter sp.]